MKKITEEIAVDRPFGRRAVLSAAGAGLAAVTVEACISMRTEAFAVTPGASTSAHGIRAFKLYSGPDNASHVLEGTIDEKARTEVLAIQFKQTPAHSSYEWHTSPEPQYVITLSGTLEFTTRNGATFVLRPGDILLSEDNVGTGHRWRLIDNHPWCRAYVLLKPGAKDSFLAKNST
jgi:quercetin dioxygenase-like cupin family protein